MSELARRTSGLLVMTVHTAHEAVVSGTGFLISSDGRLVTAEHVSADLKDAIDNIHGEPVEAKALIPAFPNLGAIPIRKLWTNPADPDRSDITVAVLQVDPSVLPLPAFGVAEEWPQLNEPVVIAGYNAWSKGDTDSLGMFELNGEFTAIATSVTGLYPEGYGMVRGPAFEMRGSIKPGMSGGPIIRPSTGEVIGICSYGGSVESQNPYCIGSVLRPERLQLVKW